MNLLLIFCMYIFFHLEINDRTCVKKGIFTQRSSYRDALSGFLQLLKQLSRSTSNVAEIPHTDQQPIFLAAALMKKGNLYILENINLGIAQPPLQIQSLIWGSSGHSGWIQARPQGAAVDAPRRAWDLWESNPR